MLTVFGVIPTKGSDVFAPIPNLFYTEKGEHALYFANGFDGISYICNGVVNDVSYSGSYSGQLIDTPPDLSKLDPFL